MSQGEAPRVEHLKHPVRAAQGESPSPHSPSALRTALAGLIGNVLEWFDFAVYGYFASEIGKQFFTQSSHTAQQFLTFGTFALGFVARPLGSLGLGRVGDRIGRRALLTLSIALMGGSTLGLGLLPTYAQAGVVAPILLVTMRMIQGITLALAGGTAPLVSTALIGWLHAPLAPAFYVMAFGLAGLAIVWPMAETNA